MNKYIQPFIEYFIEFIRPLIPENEWYSFLTLISLILIFAIEIIIIHKTLSRIIEITREILLYIIKLVSDTPDAFAKVVDLLAIALLIGAIINHNHVEDYIIASLTAIVSPIGVLIYSHYVDK